MCLCVFGPEGPSDWLQSVEPAEKTLRTRREARNIAHIWTNQKAMSWRQIKRSIKHTVRPVRLPSIQLANQMNRPELSN